MRNALFLILSALLFSCSRKEEAAPVKVDYHQIKEPLIKHNKVIHEEEMERIRAYMKRHHWKPVTTSTGINYMIVQKADTSLPKAKVGQVVRLNYEISVLDDTVVYSSGDEPVDFVVGYDHVESGLHEAVTYLRKGDKAWIILPSNLAFGLTGDNDMIPSGASLLYKVEMIDIIDRK